MDRNTSTMIDLAEAAYDLDAEEMEWLPKVMEAGLPILDHGLGVAGGIFTRPLDGGEVTLHQLHVAAGPADFAIRQAKVTAECPPEIQQACTRPGICMTLSEAAGEKYKYGVESWTRHHDYAKDALGFDEVKAAQAGTFSLWIRPFAAILAGLIADRMSPSKLIICSFGMILAGCAVIASGILGPGMFFAFFFTVATVSAGIFALRGLYFAIMGEARIPLAFTGTAVGIVSFLGYTPDIFMGPVMGYLLDRSPGELGHQHVFAVIGAFSAVGLAASLVFRRITASER
jgi:hypothetical protein